MGDYTIDGKDKKKKKKKISFFFFENLLIRPDYFPSYRSDATAYANHPPCIHYPQICIHLNFQFSSH